MQSCQERSWNDTRQQNKYEPAVGHTEAEKLFGGLNKPMCF